MNPASWLHLTARGEFTQPSPDFFIMSVLQMNFFRKFIGNKVMLSSKDCWWMMDAIMEFTSAGNMPSVFKDNAGPPVEAATVLPARMDNNQLHRYSKVKSMSHF